MIIEFKKHKTIQDIFNMQNEGSLKSKIYLILIIVAFSSLSGVLCTIFLTKDNPAFEQLAGFPLEFETTTVDHGDIKPGEELQSIFRYRNPDDASIILKKAKTSCGCMQEQDNTKTVSPKAVGELKFTISTFGKEGSFEVLIFPVAEGFKTEQPLLIKGNIIDTPARITPPMIKFSDAVPSVSHTQWVLIESIGDHFINISRVETSDPSIRVKIPPRTRKRVKVPVILDAGFASSLNREWVRFHLDEPGKGAHQVNVLVQSVSEIIAEPSALFWGNDGVRSATLSEKTHHLNLRAVNRQPFTIEKVDLPEFFKIRSIGENEEMSQVSHNYEICLAERNALPKGPWTGEVIFHATTNGQSQQVVLPVAIDR